MNTVSRLALAKIKPGMTISLGDGSNVANLAQALAENMVAGVKIVSPSEATRTLCHKLQLPFVDWDGTSSIDLAFDGCDSVDLAFHALKSMGGIHFFEKSYADCSRQYILLTKAERVQPKLNPDFPLVLEVADLAVANVVKQAEKMGLRTSIRSNKTKLGNSLLDLFADSWDQIADWNKELLQLNGVVSSSYFDQQVTGIITENGEIAKEVNHD